MFRRLRAALLASVLVHLGLVLLLKGAPEAPAAPPQAPASVELEIVTLEEPPPKTPEPEARKPVTPQPRAAPARGQAAAPAPSPVAAPAPPPQQVADAPRTTTLIPSSDVVKVEPEPSRGHTLLPKDAPSAAAVLAEGAERVRGRVQGLAEGELATARVESGLVNPYFHALRRELTAGLAHPPEVFDPNETNTERLRDWAGTLVESMSGSYKRYGATGSPETPSRLDEMARSGDVRASVGRATLERGARLREFADGRAGVDLIAVVELTQGSDGALRSAVMLQPSGVRPFDVWVLRMAETSVDALEETAPDAGAKSVWEFKGRVSYMRTSKEMDAKQDAWYVLLMAPLGMAPGTFDEVNGTVSYVDLRYPHYEATVRLLQVY